MTHSRPHITPAAVLMLTTLLIQACSLMPQNPAVTLGIQAATIEFIKKSPDPAARAAKLIEEIDRIRDQVTRTEQITLPDLVNVVRARALHRGLDPAEVLTLTTLAQGIADQYAPTVTPPTLSPDTLVSLRHTYNTIKSIARLYVNE